MARLKINGTEFDSLKAAIDATLATAEKASRETHGMSVEDWYRTNEKTHGRFRWDVLWASRWLTSEKDYRDDHIDSALKAIMGREFTNPA